MCAVRVGPELLLDHHRLAARPRTGLWGAQTRFLLHSRRFQRDGPSLRTPQVGASSAGIHFSLGKYIAYIILSTRGASPRLMGSLEGLAKAVAARL